MAQMLRHYKDADTGADNFNNYFIKEKPYQYQWKTFINELKAIRRMQSDSTDMIIRTKFFNVQLYIKMLKDYRSVINEIPDKKYGSYWGGRYGKWAVRDTCSGKIISKEDAIKYVTSFIDNATETNKLHRLHKISKKDVLNTIIKDAKVFLQTMPIKYRYTPKSKAWINAFKANGAYYTMDNMIKFHGCRFKNDMSEMLSLDESLSELKRSVETCRPAEFYKLFGLMKEFIEYNEYDIEKLQAELQAEE
jgi:hypothetical protein